ncbi:hypothetical protein PTTG_07121 [Puccinia triticina 1-1 BBBD Race 1]|uniref:Rhodanese domain-containing protein n=2 Tax=Puccinia triticina TaxID=208348 RepID=A0A180GAJ1_PUCT1|nr:uncharacterized protein PtA15_13A352 [Puccinia triticina]OAV89691.1 hypothetical protein PTTG_07121 [Puccinia triticina 1-1 BBBD Race 1]WAQ90952.1 hypothetical protein PtA15_13A352 [Puccinia triticina]
MTMLACFLPAARVKIIGQTLGPKALSRQPASRSFHSTKMSSSHPEPLVSLVSPQDVQAQGIKNFKILDSSFHLPNSGRSVLDEFRKGPRLPGARLFDHEVVADTSYTIDGTTKLGHMQPDLSTFKREVERLGITRNDHLLVYDSVGIFSGPRAAWLLNAYGHPKVSVLDGGLPRWIKEECPVETGAPIQPDKSDYELPGFDEALARGKVIPYDALVRNFKDSAEGERMCVFDARPRGRFLGTDPEPRPGLSSGHMPHSLSLPFTTLLTQPSDSEPYRKYLSPDQLEKVFLKTLNNDHQKWEQIKHGQKGVVVTCGSGMTACIIWLALRLCAPNAHHPRLYDESWTGYALRKDAQILKSS